MPAHTLLFIGRDQAARADLVFIDTPVVRVDTIAEAARYLLANRPTTGYLIAFGADVARAAGAATAPEFSRGPTRPVWGPEWGTSLVLLHGDTPESDPLWRGALRLGCSHVITLPLAWPWLREQLDEQAPAVTA